MGKLWQRIIGSLTDTSASWSEPENVLCQQTPVPSNEQYEGGQNLKESPTTGTETVPSKSQFSIFVEHLKRHNKLVDEYRKQYISDIASVIKKHYKTLETKYEQLVYADDYGYVKLDNFWPEFDYFIVNVLWQESPPFYLDSCTSADSLWDSYENLDKEYSNISVYLRDQARARSGFAWSWKTFFSFKLQLKDTGDVIEPDPQKHKLEVNFTIRTIEDTFSEKEDMSLLEGDELKIQLFQKIRYIAFTLFDYIRIKQNALDQAISQVSGVKKMRAVPDNPLEYEKYVSACLKDLGFKARPTKASGDQGADVLAEKNGVSFAIQCKKYSSPVGNKAVQEANAGRDFYKCDYGVVVSNAGFTKSAKQAANACKIILLNDTRLEKLLEYTTDRSASE